MAYRRRRSFRSRPRSYRRGLRRRIGGRPRGSRLKRRYVSIGNRY